MSASPEHTRAPPDLVLQRRAMPMAFVGDREVMLRASPTVVIDGAGCQTPESKESKIPQVLWSCPPPAPRKPRRVAVLCKRRLSELEFFEVGADDFEMLFGCEERSILKKKKKKKLNSSPMMIKQEWQG